MMRGSVFDDSDRKDSEITSIFLHRGAIYVHLVHANLQHEERILDGVTSKTPWRLAYGHSHSQNVGAYAGLRPAQLASFARIADSSPLPVEGKEPAPTPTCNPREEGCPLTARDSIPYVARSELARFPRNMRILHTA